MTDSDDTTTPTRRETLEYGATAAAVGLAGCSDLAGDGQATGTPPGGSYSVTMEPVGTVEFDSVPEQWVPYTGDWADMGVALGRGDGLAAIGVKARFGTHYYDELPGVAVDSDALTELYDDGGTGQEQFYEIGADLHVVDPNFMRNRLEWSDDEVEDIRTEVGPFFGNTIFTRVYDWHDYRYYSLYEAFEKLAAVFRERERYEAFRSYHDEVVGEVQSRLPATTPEIAVLFPAGTPPDTFYPYLVGDGTQSKHWRDLQVDDALAANGVTDAQAGGGTIDYETLLEIDPDAIGVRISGEITAQYFRENIVEHMDQHPVASELTAVQNDRVYYAGQTYQGPIIHLFQLEAAAQGLYPEQFGDEQLFDRQRVAEIVNGELDDE